MATIYEVRALYHRAKYRELIELAGKQISANEPFAQEKSLLVGWAHHQLGEYAESIQIFRGFVLAYAPRNEFGESARRGLAHGLLQTGGNFADVEAIMEEIPPSLDLDNVYMNAALIRARKGETISVQTVLGRLIAALKTVPYKTVNGHVINNGALALHEARNQDAVKPYLPILPGLMFAAIKIYSETGTAKNHLAGAMFRASQICEVSGWPRLAKIEAESSVALWEELVASQGGERYKQNLEGAEKLLKELMMNATIDNRPPTIDRIDR